MVGLWFQTNPDQSLTPFLPVPCEQLLDLYDDADNDERRFRSQLKYQLCADMNSEDMRLQNTIDGDWVEGAQTYHFAVDTCENFMKYTNWTTC